MNYYYFKLVPPRTTFPGDATEAEWALMGAHATYWKEKLNAGLAVALGPVADPNGTFGMGIISVPEGVDAKSLCASDPVLLANAGFTFELHPMLSLMVADTTQDQTIR